MTGLVLGGVARAAGDSVSASGVDTALRVASASPTKALELTPAPSAGFALHSLAGMLATGVLTTPSLPWQLTQAPARPAAADELEPIRLDFARLGIDRHDPVRTHYDARDNLLVDMSYWETRASSLRMLYGQRVEEDGLAAVDARLDEQVGIDFDLDLGAGTFEARSGRSYDDATALSLPGDEADSGYVEYVLSGNRGKFEYGADYAYAGSGFERFLEASQSLPQQDHETRSLWLQVALGNRFSLRAVTEEYREDLEAGNERPKYVDELAGLRAHVVLNNWPYVGSSVWFKQGAREPEHVPDGTAAQPRDLRRSGAAFSVRTGWGDHSLSTTYSLADDGLGAAASNERVSRHLSSTLYPSRRFSLGATVSASHNAVREGSDLWAGDYASESVWASFDPPARDFSLNWARYVDDYSTRDGGSDYTEAYGVVSVAFENVSLFDTRVPLEVKLQRTDYRDAAHPTASSDDTALWLELGSASRSGHRRPAGMGPFGSLDPFRW